MSAIKYGCKDDGKISEYIATKSVKSFSNFKTNDNDYY